MGVPRVHLTRELLEAQKQGRVGTETPEGTGQEAQELGERRGQASCWPAARGNCCPGGQRLTDRDKDTPRVENQIFLTLGPREHSSAGPASSTSAARNGHGWGAQATPWAQRACDRHGHDGHKTQGCLNGPTWEPQP